MSVIYTMNSWFKPEVAIFESYFFESKEVNRVVSNFFEINKYQSLNENILFVSKNIYEMLNEPLLVDLIFEKYAQKFNLELNINLERVLYFSLIFLFSIELVDFNSGVVRRM